MLFEHKTIIHSNQYVKDTGIIMHSKTATANVSSNALKFRVFS